MASGYLNTFITISPDCPVAEGTVPPRPDSVAGLEHTLLGAKPYEFTGDDLILAVQSQRRGISGEADVHAFAKELFSKPHACLRASMLPKRYGWGVHYDERGRIAIYGCETESYRLFASRPDLIILAGMRSRKPE